MPPGTGSAERLDYVGPAVAEHSDEKRVIVVMPARNAARTLAATFAPIPEGWVDEVIVVDDKSTDATVEVARRLELHTTRHPHNVGYGGNQKHSYEFLSPRETVGLDREAVALAGQARPTVVGDMRDLPFASGSFASVVSVHLIEHVPDARPVVGGPPRVK